MNYIIIYAFIIFCCTSGLLLFLITYSLFNKRVNRLFFILAFLTLLLGVCDIIEMHTITFEHYTSLRLVENVFSYIIKCLYAVVFLEIINKNKYIRYLSYILLGICVICSFTAFFSDICFSITPDNVFVRGPLNYIVLFCNFCQLFLIMVLAIKMTIDFKNTNFLFFSFFCVICIIASIMEFVLTIYGFINCLLIVTVIFYYIYLQSRQFRQDELTGAYNRLSLRIDVEKLKKKGFTLLSLDLNDFKKINDTFGHQAGDEALKTVVAASNEIVGKYGYSLYRTGGDEFIIISTSLDQKFNEKLIESIKQNVKKTGNDIAIGYSIFYPNSDFTEVLNMADENMYVDKLNRKENNNIEK